MSTTDVSPLGIRGRAGAVAARRARRGAQTTRFLLAGALSALLDLVAVVTVHQVLGAPVWLSGTCGVGVGLLVNFSLQRGWAFGAGGSSLAGQGSRYAVLVGANWAATLLLLHLLVGAGIAIAPAKAATTAVLAVANFRLYRAWVFA